MSNGTRQIRLKPAHDELQKLLAEIEKVDVTKLPDKDGASTPTATSWVAALKEARVALTEWCGSPSAGENQFMLEVPSKR